MRCVLIRFTSFPATRPKPATRPSASVPGSGATTAPVPSVAAVTLSSRTLFAVALIEMYLYDP